MTTIHIIENPFPNVPAPAGAAKVCEWADQETAHTGGAIAVAPRRGPDIV